jgi:hypothetical protein
MFTEKGVQKSHKGIEPSSTRHYSTKQMQQTHATNFGAATLIYTTRGQSRVRTIIAAISIHLLAHNTLTIAYRSSNTTLNLGRRPSATTRSTLHYPKSNQPSRLTHYPHDCKSPTTHRHRSGLTHPHP